MDLHDYKDVAENYDRYLEVMYQTENHYDGFVEFYTDLAKKYGSGGIIDIACGTGAVVLGLAEQGIIADAVAGQDAVHILFIIEFFAFIVHVFSSSGVCWNSFYCRCRTAS